MVIIRRKLGRQISQSRGYGPTTQSTSSTTTKMRYASITRRSSTEL